MNIDGNDVMSDERASEEIKGRETVMISCRDLVCRDIILVTHTTANALSGNVMDLTAGTNL